MNISTLTNATINNPIEDSKLISLRLPSSFVVFLKSKSKKEGRTVSNYLRYLVMQSMDETEYLMSNPVSYT